MCASLMWCNCVYILCDGHISSVKGHLRGADDGENMIKFKLNNWKTSFYLQQHGYLWLSGGRTSWPNACEHLWRKLVHAVHGSAGSVFAVTVWLGRSMRTTQGNNRNICRWTASIFYYWFFIGFRMFCRPIPSTILLWSVLVRVVLWWLRDCLRCPIGKCFWSRPVSAV